MGSQRVEHNWVSIHSQLTCFIGNRKVTGPFTRVVFLPCLCLCQSPASLRKINPAAIVLQVHTWLLLTSQHLENIRIYYFQLFMNLGWFWLALILRRAHNTKNIRPPSLKTLRWYIGRIIQTSSNVCTLWCVLSGVFSLFPFQAVIRQMWGFHSRPNKNIFFENLKAF